jgi:hypothetical protein
MILLALREKVARASGSDEGSRRADRKDELRHGRSAP